MTEYNGKVETYEISGSSSVARIEYDNLVDTLKVSFRTGGSYMYAGVERQVYVDMCEAESAGKFFHANIKGHYDFFKLSLT